MAGNHRESACRGRGRENLPASCGALDFLDQTVLAHDAADYDH
jgi:hypothetical protein